VGAALSSFGFWLLAFGFWLLAFGFWLLAFGFWLLAFGFWLLVGATSVAMLWLVLVIKRRAFVRRGRPKALRFKPTTNNQEQEHRPRAGSYKKSRAK
jgi:membrane protein implicated in regulation of membrane protease activity